MDKVQKALDERNVKLSNLDNNKMEALSASNYGTNHNLLKKKYSHNKPLQKYLEKSNAELKQKEEQRNMKLEKSKAERYERIKKLMEMKAELHCNDTYIDYKESNDKEPLFNDDSSRSSLSSRSNLSPNFSPRSSPESCCAKFFNYF